MSNLIHKETVYYLQGVGFRIHNELKGGHREADYEQALVWTLDDDGVQFRRQPEYRIDYKGKQVGKYRPDLVIGDKDILLELKAASNIEATHIAQVLSCLSVTGIDLGLLMNFGAASMQYRRLPNFTGNRVTGDVASPHPPDGILFPALTNQIIQALFEVKRELGSGFLHQVYRRATRVELGYSGLNYRYITNLPLRYGCHELGEREVRLIAVESKVLVATVALKTLLPKHTEKLKWAMQVMGYRLGVVANFYPAILDLKFFRNS